MKGQSKEQVAEFFNTATDTMGNYLLHVCATYGSCTSSLTPYGVRISLLTSTPRRCHGRTFER